jgi:23S rRNA (uracil1939-C5)-methyltransferase
MSTLRKGTPVAARPSALDDLGAGVAEGEGVRLHIPGALAGEEVEAEIEHASSHRRGGAVDVWARLLRVIHPSADRTVPACPGFGVCGGCPVQHLRYQAQVAWKGTVVERRVKQTAEIAQAAVDACIASPKSLGYRNQAKYVYGRTGEGRLVLGAYAPRSHRVVDLAGCRVIEPPLDEVARTLRDLLEGQAVLPFDERRRTGLLRYAILRSNERGQVLVTLVTHRRQWPTGPELARTLLRVRPEVVGVVQNVNPTAGNVLFGAEEILLDGQQHLDEVVGGVQVALSSRAFVQLNRQLAALAYAQIRKTVERLSPVDTVVDAYAGVGGIAFSLASVSQRLIAIENNPAAAAAGKAAARDAGLGHIQFQPADAAQGLAAVPAADVVVLNPPRAGCAPAVLGEVARLRPRLLAYLSCNPVTLCRDLSILKARGLEIRRLTPLDMLPHTAHVEVLALLAPVGRPLADH